MRGGGQVTALGQPKLLERVSNSLVAVHNLFRRFDEDLNGVVTRDEFEMVCLLLPLITLSCAYCSEPNYHILFVPGVVSAFILKTSRPAANQHAGKHQYRMVQAHTYTLKFSELSGLLFVGQVYSELFDDGTPERLQEIFNALETDNKGAPYPSQPVHAGFNFPSYYYQHLRLCLSMSWPDCDWYPVPESDFAISERRCEKCTRCSASFVTMCKETP